MGRMQTSLEPVGSEIQWHGNPPTFSGRQKWS
ncbi:hypothetical protein XAP412_500005 [Xanthomonas phaseoli pv. phaseoli]|uniref:Transposase n=1 Tax=Xanthomonas campestris pv. phaseoli TaxID=317013 RepID=A0AB38E267_XANCH|nr:hypothetical protein XAP6984_550005 [Xanthomonas phaseoli pv. phaseoli]SON86942.1 hypothetical protein XAP412_500005 [Xanthomonas phaseoli pv. phaseoli]SON90950.1 hypothetical protein XAP7430_510005 [Xanthomonas phaseoli pv. phaseoli]